MKQPVTQRQWLNVHGARLEIDSRWSDVKAEGLYLHVTSSSAFEAHVLVALAGRLDHVAVCSLFSNGLTAQLTLNSMSNSPEKRFYNFTILTHSFYSPYADDLVEHPMEPLAWLKMAFKSLEEFYQEHMQNWPALQHRAELFVAKANR